MNGEDTKRDANLRYLEQHVPYVFSWGDPAVARLGDADIEQFVRYARWLEEHRHDETAHAETLVQKVRSAGRTPARRATSSHIQ